MKNLHQQLIQVMKGSGKQIKYPLGNYPVNADTIYIACAKLAEAVYVDNKELEKDRFFTVANNLLLGKENFPKDYATVEFKTFSEPTRNCKFSYLYSKCSKFLIISFRGTEASSFKNWSSNINFASQELKIFNHQTQVHQGFYSCFQLLGNPSKVYLMPMASIKSDPPPLGIKKFMIPYLVTFFTSQTKDARKFVHMIPYLVEFTPP